MTAPILKLRATKTPGEGFPLLGIAPDWFIETVGMRGSDVADAVIALGGDDALIHLLARAPELAAALAAEKVRADNAERMVAELRERWRAVTRAYFGSSDPVIAINEFDAALSSTADVAGRWVSVEQHRHVADKARAYGDIVHACTPALVRAGHPHGPVPKDTIAACVDALANERDAAIARADEASKMALNMARTAERIKGQLASERDAAIAARDEAVAAFERSGAKGLVAMAQRDAAERARDEVGGERDQWREALTEIIRNLDDEDGCMEIDCEPLDPRETSAQQIVTAVVRRVADLQSWTRRYVMGDQMRGDATSDEENARARVQTLIVDRDNAIRARDEVGIQLAAAQAEIARLHKGLREVERFMLSQWRPPAEAVLALVRDVAAGGPSVPGDALPPSPAGVSGQPSGSTPAASSATASSSEVEGSRCGQSGTPFDLAGYLGLAATDTKGVK